MTNPGFDSQVIKEHQAKMGGKGFYIVDSEDNSNEYVNFFFVGIYENKEVLFDAAIYTLRLSHNSELYEIAEHEAAKRFPGYKNIIYEENENDDLSEPEGDEEEIGLFMAELMMELEEEGDVKVAEHVEIDTNIDFGVGLDVALNVDQITEDVISSFIKNYNKGTLELDSTMYAFKTGDEEFSN